MLGKFGAKLAIRRALRQDEEVRVGLLQRDVMDAAADSLLEQYECECMAQGKSGDLQSFFEWLLEHQEEIIAFIKLLIDLFSKD